MDTRFDRLLDSLRRTLGSKEFRDPTVAQAQARHLVDRLSLALQVRVCVLCLVLCNGRVLCKLRVCWCQARLGVAPRRNANAQPCAHEHTPSHVNSLPTLTTHRPHYCLLSETPTLRSTSVPRVWGGKARGITAALHPATTPQQTWHVAEPLWTGSFPTMRSHHTKLLGGAGGVAVAAALCMCGLVRWLVVTCNDHQSPETPPPQTHCPG